MQISVPLSAHSSWGPSPRRGVAGPRGNSAFDILRAHQTVSTAAAPLCIPAVRARSGFSRAEVGPFPASVSQRRSGGGGGGLRALTLLTCRPESEPAAPALCLSRRTQTQGGAEAWRRGSGHGTGSNPGRLPSQLMLLNVLALISLCFFPCLSKFML